MPGDVPRDVPRITDGCGHASRVFDDHSVLIRLEQRLRSWRLR